MARLTTAFFGNVQVGIGHSKEREKQFSKQPPQQSAIYNQSAGLSDLSADHHLFTDNHLFIDYQLWTDRLLSKLHLKPNSMHKILIFSSSFLRPVRCATLNQQESCLDPVSGLVRNGQTGSEGLLSDWTVYHPAYCCFNNEPQVKRYQTGSVLFAHHLDSRRVHSKHV